jgi:hypothetical protein
VLGVAIADTGHRHDASTSKVLVQVPYTCAPNSFSATSDLHVGAYWASQRYVDAASVCLYKSTSRSPRSRDAQSNGQPASGCRFLLAPCPQRSAPFEIRTGDPLCLAMHGDGSLSLNATTWRLSSPTQQRLAGRPASRTNVGYRGCGGLVCVDMTARDRLHCTTPLGTDQAAARRRGSTTFTFGSTFQTIIPPSSPRPFGSTQLP